MRKKIRLLIVNDNQEFLDAIIDLLKPFSECKVVGKANNGQQAVNLALEFKPDIIIMDAKMPVMDGFTASKKITQGAPYIGIILTGVLESVEVLREAMQCGAGDFLELPLSGTKLYSAISLLYEVKQQQKNHLLKNALLIPSRRPKVISVFSTKGGVGKTVVATNVAVSLKQQTREDVLLIDLDLQFGDVGDLLNMNPKASIIDLLDEKSNIDINEFDRYLATHHTGIKVLAAPKEPEQADLVNEEDVKEIISIFRKSFDYIVLDLPPFFNGITIGCMEISDHVLFLSNMEVPTLKNVKGGIEILKKLEFPDEKIILIINRFCNNVEIKLEDIKNFIDIKKINPIEDNSEIVSTSINVGEPFVLRSSKSLIAKQITNIVNNMIEYKNNDQRKKKDSILRRIFKIGG